MPIAKKSVKANSLKAYMQNRRPRKLTLVNAQKACVPHPAGSPQSQAVCTIGARQFSIDRPTDRGSGCQALISPKRSASRVRQIRNTCAGVGLRGRTTGSEGAANFSGSPSQV